MIELPEAVLLAEQLNATIKGKEITEVIVGFTPHKFAFYYQNPEEYAVRLAGKKITSACNQGGLVEIQAEDSTIVLSDGANIKHLEPQAKLPTKHQLLIGFQDQSCLVVSVRMYAMLWCFPDGELKSDYYLAGKERPNPFSSQFNKEYFFQLASSEILLNKSVKAFLATEQRIPGLGNGVLQDILYRAHIHPKTKLPFLTLPQKEELYTQIQQTLTEMYNLGGRDSEKDLFGIAGKYHTRLNANTAGQPCCNCGSVIQKENYLGGSIYFCPECQPLQQ